VNRVLLDPDVPFEIPADIAVCPYCSKRLTAQFTGWEEEQDGTWTATDIDLDCESEPDIDDDEWWPWFEGHSVMPYVYMLPVHNRVKAWLAENYCSQMDGAFA